MALILRASIFRFVSGWVLKFQWSLRKAWPKWNCRRHNHWHILYSRWYRSSELDFFASFFFNFWMGFEIPRVPSDRTGNPQGLLRAKALGNPKPNPKLYRLHTQNIPMDPKVYRRKPKLYRSKPQSIPIRQLLPRFNTEEVYRRTPKTYRRSTKVYR